ncbi:MAG: hypothetical protein HY286_12615 [Planctomycetes bacterium]|nr:hypothetical protein [Planctomycetota bacterium]
MRLRTLLIIVTCLSTALCAGCVIVNLVAGRKRDIPFSHATHIKKEMTCEACHSDAESEDRAGMPSRDVCITCHDIKPDKTPKDFEKVIVASTELKFPEWNKLVDLKFSHKTHVAKMYKCADCHGDVEQSTDLDESVIVKMDACIACHAKEGRKTDCASCHNNIREDARPPSHNAAFLKLHGRDVRGSSDALAEGKCLICHGPQSDHSCERCHAETPPANHNEFWRQRGHAGEAELDREACGTCHREDSCIRCHSEVRPSNHLGAWGGTFSAHCFSCHEPLSANGCSACHKSTPAHLSAPHRPPPPHPGPNADCRSCHLPNLLIHADNGENCTICHH